MDLECIPNRDAIRYETIYGIESAETLFRGTLRYHGFCGIMNVMKNFGLFEERQSPYEKWEDLIEHLVAEKGHADMAECVMACAHENYRDAKNAERFLHWLAFRDKKLDDSNNILMSFCKLLEDHLHYQQGERDMVRCATSTLNAIDFCMFVIIFYLLAFF